MVTPSNSMNLIGFLMISLLDGCAPLFPGKITLAAFRHRRMQRKQAKIFHVVMSSGVTLLCHVVTCCSVTWQNAVMSWWHAVLSCGNMKSCNVATCCYVMYQHAIMSCGDTLLFYVATHNYVMWQHAVMSYANMLVCHVMVSRWYFM